MNPAVVTAWRLIGYENRRLAHQDFADDTKDAGEIGAGLSVTALYEIVPVGVPYDGPSVGERRYEKVAEAASGFAGELMFLKLRYKAPDGDVSRLLQAPVDDAVTPWTGATNDFRWAAAVAAFAELLRGSEHLGGFDLAGVKQVAWGARGDDPKGRRAEFLELVDRAARLRDEPR
ncbi:MAG: YfbK domain-containing protein [Planctomycetota bacterium JB042]